MQVDEPQSIEEPNLKAEDTEVAETPEVAVKESITTLRHEFMILFKSPEASQLCM